MSAHLIIWPCQEAPARNCRSTAFSQRTVSLAFRRVAAVGPADVGHLQDQAGDVPVEGEHQIGIADLGILQRVVQIAGSDDGWRCPVLQQRDRHLLQVVPVGLAGILPLLIEVRVLRE
jgi:hypothetical protein